MSAWTSKILVVGLISSVVCLANSKQRFMTTVQIAVKEPTLELSKRSQGLVAHQIKQAFATWPRLQGRRYDIKKQGDELFLTLLSQQDMQQPVQNAVFHMIRNLNGKVHARGQTRFYRTTNQRPIRGFLKVIVTREDLNGEWIQPELDEVLDVESEEVAEPPRAEEDRLSETRIVSISAMAVRLRDVLKEMQRKVGSFGYLVPGECMNRRVSWSFGEDRTEPPRTVRAVMAQLATFLGLKHEQTYGTHIFQGTCAQEPQHVNPEFENFEGMPTDPWGVTDVSLTQNEKTHPQGARVFIPLMPLSY